MPTCCAREPTHGAASLTPETEALDAGPRVRPARAGHQHLGMGPSKYFHEASGRIPGCKASPLPLQGHPGSPGHPCRPALPLVHAGVERGCARSALSYPKTAPSRPQLSPGSAHLLSVASHPAPGCPPAGASILPRMFPKDSPALKKKASSFPSSCFSDLV